MQISLTHILLLTLRHEETQRPVTLHTENVGNLKIFAIQALRIFGWYVSILHTKTCNKMVLEA
jgi:hypothetical protein